LYRIIFEEKEGMFMQKSNLFFTYLSKLNLEKDKLSKEENQKVESSDEFDEATKTDNEWFQEYELIYKSYSIG
jgi:hypothetical protein